MQPRTIALVTAALAAACVVSMIALNERTARSPNALLGQKLYPYYPYGNAYGYGGYLYGYGYGYGYPYDYGYGESMRQYDDAVAQQQYADYAQQQQYDDYVRQQQYADQTNQYYAWAASQYKPKAGPAELKVPKNQQLVYMGDLEFGGYRHDITGGNDGGYNAPFDINGDGQEIDNWAKVTTQWKHKKGSEQLKGKKDSKGESVQLKTPTDTSTSMLRAPSPDMVWRKGFGYLQPYQGGTGQVWHKGYDKHPGPIPDENNPTKPWGWYKGARSSSIPMPPTGQKLKAEHRLTSLRREQPEDWVWQKGFNRQTHPGPIPSESAPMRPWYWYNQHQ